MDYQALKALIEPRLADSDEDIANWCNTPSVIVTKERFVTNRTLMAELGPAVSDTILNKLELAAQENSITQRVITMLKPSEGGIDVNLDAVRTQIAGLVPTVLDQSEADAITSLANIEMSPASAAGLPVIRIGDVKYTRTI